VNWTTSIRLFLRLKPAEFLMLQVTFVLVLLDALMIFQKGITLDIGGYTKVICIALFMISGGYFYRLSKRSDRIAYAMIGAGLFSLFMMCMGLFNYLLLPLTGGTIDIYIAQIDAMLGFHWPDVMALAAQYPTISFILKLAYASTTLQLAFLIILLGLSGRIYDLHIMLATITITAVLTICFWAIVPSVGPTAMYTLPNDVWTTLNPFVGKEYGGILNELIANGASYISPAELRGLIAFPSYHAVLAFTAMYAARNVKYVAPVFLILNLLILPSIFIHGGHHFLDLPAGFLMFLFGTWLAKNAMEKYKQAPHASVVLAS